MMTLKNMGVKKFSKLVDAMVDWWSMVILIKTMIKPTLPLLQWSLLCRHIELVESEQDLQKL